MGFDAETKDGHRVYWPEKRRVSVERSVRFNVEEEVIVDVLPLEGENMPEIDDERPTINNADNRDVDNVIPDAEIPNPVPEVVEGRGKRIRKETEYVRMLREGSGTTGGRTGETLPRGMQSGTVPVTADTQRTEYATSVSLEPELDHAMAAVVEGLEPTFEEAKRRPDWPKWQEAIK